jgi:hypothetical protein
LCTFKNCNLHKKILCFLWLIFASFWPWTPPKRMTLGPRRLDCCWIPYWSAFQRAVTVSQNYTHNISITYLRAAQICMIFIAALYVKKKLLNLKEGFKFLLKTLFLGIYVTIRNSRPFCQNSAFLWSKKTRNFVSYVLLNTARAEFCFAKRK